VPACPKRQHLPCNRSFFRRSRFPNKLIRFNYCSKNRIGTGSCEHLHVACIKYDTKETDDEIRTFSGISFPYYNVSDAIGT
jgi:hypothetical protein